ncbi:MAG TPA: inorganic phosphate transporter, partial [Bryobacteraceae bacterium]|nr:inorganic phosphate transporter [Bryobacteraceae bacterium]
MTSLALTVIALALLFDYINGFHDSANSIATIVATRVLKPVQAVIWAAFFNLVAAFFLGTGVASSISKDYVEPGIVTPWLVLAGLAGAIIWNLITWWLGLPTSSSHALIGGYAGAAIAKAGFQGLVRGKWPSTISFIVFSPVIGLVLAYTLMVIVAWIFRRV